MPKISDLPADSAPEAADLIPFVDVTASRTESVTLANLAASTAFTSQYLTQADAATDYAPLGAVPAALYLPGTSGNYVGSPDAADWDVAGDIEIVFRAALADYTPTATNCIVARRTTGEGLHFQLAFLLTTGALAFSMRTGAADYFNNSSAANPGYVDGTTYWWRYRRASATGTVTAGYAPDSPTEPSSYTSLTVTGTQTAGAIDASAAPAEIGSNRGGGSDLATGNIMNVIVRSGFSGTTVGSFDAAIAGGPRYRDSTGKVWTINGSAWSWTRAT